MAASLFALGAPLSVFLTQAGIFTALALVLARPRFALQPLARHPHLGAALAFYFLIQMGSIVYSQHQPRSLLCLRGDWPVLYLPILLAVLQTPRARRVAWAAALGAATLAGLLGTFQHFSGIDPLGKTVLESDGSGGFHAVGSLRGHLTYGGVMLIATAAAVGLLLTAPRRLRPALLFAAAACVLGLVLSYARTALLGVLAGAAAATGAALARGGRGRERRRFVIVTGALVAAGCVLLVLVTPGVRSRLANLLHFGANPRLRLWGTALAIFADFPLLGAGLGAFKSHFPLYRLPGEYMATGHPHNDVLNVLVHSGLAGLLAWGALWWAVVHAAAARLPLPRRRGGFDPGVMAIGLVAAFLAAGMGQCYFTDEEPAAMLWLLLALAISERDAAGAAGAPDAARTARGQDAAAALASARSRRGRPLSRLERAGKRALLPLAAALFLPRARRAAPGARAMRPDILGEARRILLVRQDNRLGNLVLMTPCLQALREAAPGAHIGLLAGSRFSAVLAGAPWIDELIVMHKRALIRRPWSFPAHLGAIRAGGWDLAVDLSNPDTHSFYNAFVPLVAAARWRVGFDHPQSRPALNAWVPPPERECHYSLAPLLLLSAMGAAPAPHPLRLSPALLARARERATSAGPAATPSGGGPIVVHPGGRGAKQWPAEAFVALIRALAAQRRGPVLVIGGGAERALLETLASELPGVEMREIGDLEGLVGTLDGARLYVGCDAGPLHVAAALDVPVVALFLTSHPGRYAPLGDRHVTVVLGEQSRAWLTADRPRSDARTHGDGAGPAEPAPPGSARGRPPARGALTLLPDPALAGMLEARHPSILLAPEGLGLGAQVELVLAEVDRTLTGARGDSALESRRGGPEDRGTTTAGKRGRG